MNAVTCWAPLLGRIGLSAIFLISGAGKIFSWEQTAGYMSSKGMPLVPLFLVGAIVLELVGGLSVLVGYKARLGAGLLIVFLIPATVIFHNFWAFEGQEQQMQMIMFLKNLAILGGLLLVVGFGAGAYSLDNRCGSCVSSSPVSGTASPTA
ncbi:MAG: DoxX family protein [Gemmataceae bacterium]|nr:DoxX family protein [Gemmataceae bacterium]MDW8243338.1 DoxX family protein [Thermogemmata sp.]